MYMQDFYRGLMGRDKFLLILRFWFFGDEADENENPAKDAKVFSLVDHLNKVMRMHYVPEKHLSLDESLLAWRGRLSFRVYMGTANKHCKYGIKYFELCTSAGLILRAVMHTVSQQFQDPLDLGQSGAIVIKLMKDFLQQGYHLYMDNWYNSVPLAEELTRQGTYLVGTVNKKRKGLPKKMIRAQLKKGEWAWQSNGSTTVTKWHDKRDVLMISNMHPEVKMESVINKRGQTIWKPNTVMDYNKHMSGVDRSDQMLSYNSSLRKSLRWYKKIGIHMLEIFLINAHFLYQEEAGKREDLKAMTLLEFREAIVLALVGEDKRSDKKKKKQSVPQTTVHHPAPLPPNAAVKRANPIKECVHCKQTTGARKSSRYYCPVCTTHPALCIWPCFRDYHEQLREEPEDEDNSGTDESEWESD